MDTEDYLIEELSPSDVEQVAALIKRNLSSYQEAGTVLAATFRRLDDLLEHYQREGRRFFVAKDPSNDGRCIGCAGIGSLHGLPASEGMGEIRDLVVEKSFRGKGLGTRLLKRCLSTSRDFGYKRIYLETTPQMENAQKLFQRFGFRPVTEAKPEGAKASANQQMPCYYLLENSKEESIG